MGAYLVVTAWAAGAAAVLVAGRWAARARLRHPDSAVVTPLFALGGSITMLGAFVVLAGLLLALHSGSFNAVDVDRAYLTGSGAIAGTALLLGAGLLFLLRGVSLDPPPRSPDVQP